MQCPLLPRQQSGQFVPIDFLRIGCGAAAARQHTLHLQIEGAFAIAFRLAELARIGEAGRRMEAQMHVAVETVCVLHQHIRLIRPC